MKRLDFVLKLAGEYKLEFFKRKLLKSVTFVTILHGALSQRTVNYINYFKTLKKQLKIINDQKFCSQFN